VAQSPYAIVLFDGVCGLCNASIDFLLRRDRRGVLRFAALQSPIAQSLLRQHGLDASELSSVVVIDGAQVYRRSDAALHAVGRLGASWRTLAAIARLLPHRWFGRRATCRIPTPQERARFLPD
jgi:predicted DCC family thiol-disulfide oxidoreductase YuxK